MVVTLGDARPGHPDISALVGVLALVDVYVPNLPEAARKFRSLQRSLRDGD
ncbi:hypothetical protein HDA40_008038 [Hamadaea flava]|uniref:Uncharacterized protein n=1 Tax=Hamadaea flava TaxID=1742688 RepID=A0ABV8LV07_9ACTN|nr:hypothetical protein [Hamadaea flava]MCP2329531.1 hypothetical protein [Hamadaea flava]